MKKIVSLLSASVLALSLIGCSGDLHDTDASPLFIEGDCWGTRTALAFDGDEQVIEFKYEDNDDCKKWGGSAGTVNFKIMTEAVGWNDDFGAPKDETLELKINDDFTETHSRKNEGIGGAGPGNIVLKDLAEGSKYKIHVKYDSAANTAKIKVTGNVTDYPNLRVVVGTEELSMTRQGSTYTYLYTPEKDGSFEYYITNGFLYWDDSGDITDKNGKNTATLSYKYEKWADGSVKQYYISVDASKLPKVTVTSGIYDPSILGKAGIVGTNFGWDGSSKLTKVNDTTYEYSFTAKASEEVFAIQEIAGSWATRWCGQDANANSSGNYDKSKYSTIKPGDSVKLSYIKGGDPEHCHMNLSVGSEYKLIFTISGKDVTAKLELTKAVEIVPVDLSGHALYLIETTGDSTEALVWGNEFIKPEFNDGEGEQQLKVDAKKLTKVTDRKYTYDIDLEGKTLTKGYFTLAIITSSWWGNRHEMPKGTYSVGNKIKTASSDQGDNRGLVQLEAKKYLLTVDIENADDVYFTITEK